MNMCIALEELRREGVLEGQREGRLEGRLRESVQR